jgi:hypothetical protein
MAEMGSQLAAGLDPRRKIYRNRFNEYFVFLASATGAAIQVPVVMLVLSLIIGKLELIPFLAISVAIEWFIIFALARPQMKRLERVGWAALWGFTTAVFALCFYYLVIDNVI